eukprot:scaffold142089_cov32-Tisochrysis_lutea.AAC.1
MDLNPASSSTRPGRSIPRSGRVQWRSTHGQRSCPRATPYGEIERLAGEGRGGGRGDKGVRRDFERDRASRISGGCAQRTPHFAQSLVHEATEKHALSRLGAGCVD